MVDTLHAGRLYRHLPLSFQPQMPPTPRVKYSRSYSSASESGPINDKLCTTVAVSNAYSPSYNSLESGDLTVELADVSINADTFDETDWIYNSDANVGIKSNYVFFASYHLTDVRPEDDFANAGITIIQVYDLLFKCMMVLIVCALVFLFACLISQLSSGIHPETQKWVHFGRPDIPKIFSQTRELCELENISKVGVGVCGPPELVHDVHDLCRETLFPIDIRSCLGGMRKSNGYFDDKDTGENVGNEERKEGDQRSRLVQFHLHREVFSF